MNRRTVEGWICGTCDLWYAYAEDAEGCCPPHVWEESRVVCDACNDILWDEFDDCSCLEEEEA